MNSEIEKRIEQIDQGIVPEGYKKIKEGIVPEDWEEKKFEDIFIETIDYRGKTPTKVESGIVLLTAKNIKKGYLDFTDSIEYIDENDYDNVMRRGVPSKGDIVITTEAPMGNVALLDDDKYAIAQRTIKLSTGKIKSNKYFNFKLLDNRFQLELLREATGSTVKGIKGSRLKKIKIALPPLVEQEKIADILSLWDQAIETTEKLIKEKKIQKKGLMQELLTGKTRLPGFDGDLEEVRLGEVANVFDGVHQTPDYKDQGIPFVSVENINDINNTEKYISEEDYIKDYVNRNKKAEKNDIFMTRIGSIGVPHLIEQDTELAYYVTLALIKIKTENIDSRFLYYNIQSNSFQQELFRKTLHVAYPNKINLGEIGLIKFKYPSLKEQKAIANILSDVDKEIQLLKQLLASKKQEKKGLMQVLLTGIARV